VAEMSMALRAGRQLVGDQRDRHTERWTVMNIPPIINQSTDCVCFWFLCIPHWVRYCCHYLLFVLSPPFLSSNISKLLHYETQEDCQFIASQSQKGTFSSSFAQETHYHECSSFAWSAHKIWGVFWFALVSCSLFV
jgi:hypothetical protein